MPFACAYSGRMRRTLSRNQVLDPSQPMRSTITVAGIVGWAASRARTRSSAGVKALATEGREYFGGWSAATVRATVSTARPSFFAMALCESPSPQYKWRINAQSSHRDHPSNGVWVAWSSTVVLDLVFPRRRHCCAMTPMNCATSGPDSNRSPWRSTISGQQQPASPALPTASSQPETCQKASCAAPSTFPAPSTHSSLRHAMNHLR